MQNQISSQNRLKICIFVNVDWFVLSHFKDYLEKIVVQNHEVTILTLDTGRCNELRSIGVKVIPIDLHRGNSNIYTEFKTLLTIFTTLRDIAPDVLELITIKPVIYGGLVAKVLKIKKTVFYMSGLGSVFTYKNTFGFAKASLVTWLYKIIMRSSEAEVIVENEDDQNIFNSIVGVEPKKIHLIAGVGVDLKDFSPSLNYSSRNLRVAAASRLLYDKGILEFYAAAKICKTAWPDVEFLLAGEIDATNPESLCKEDLIKLRATGVVKDLGHCTSMASFLKTVDIFVLPSYREGFPRVIMEAAATGLPVVTTDVTGCRSAVVDNKTGFIVPAKNADVLAIAIQKLIASPDIRAELGKNSRAHAETFFDVNFLTSKHINVWKKKMSLS